MYPEFVTQSFESNEAHVDHIFSKQQEIHDLVRRNAHQAQRRQKLKYDQNIRAKAYSVGEPVWVFCRYIPQKGTPKLMRAWRGPHKVARKLQEERVYVLDTGQKVHFERLKPQNSGPTEWATIPTKNGDVTGVMNPEPEHSLEETPDDASQPSYREEQSISEASNSCLPPRQRHWMDIRLRIRAGGTRRSYQQFGSSTDTDEESSNVLLSSAQAETNEEQELATQPVTLTVQPVEMPQTPTNNTGNLFSEHEMIEVPTNEQETQQPASETGTSLIGTSAPLISDPSLTDVLSNFPIWPQLDLPITQDPQATIPMSSQKLVTSSIGATGHVSSATTEEERKPKGRSSAATTTNMNNQYKVVAEVCAKEDVPEALHPRRLLFLPSKLHHQHLIPRSPILVLT